MNERELRELDIQVHEALYPNVTLAVRGWGDIPTHWLDVGRMVEIPRYTTDIGAWDAVYALHPEWRWSIADSVDGTETHVWLMGAGYYRSIPKGHGPAVWALGMARCVLAWAAGRGEG